MIDVLRSYVAAKKFRLHDLVILPDHLHLLLRSEVTSIERAMPFVKGGFLYRVRKEHGDWGEVWQRGFCESRIEDRGRFARHREYNPVKAGLADSPEEYPYCFAD